MEKGDLGDEKGSQKGTKRDPKTVKKGHKNETGKKGKKGGPWGGELMAVVGSADGPGRVPRMWENGH